MLDQPIIVLGEMLGLIVTMQQNQAKANRQFLGALQDQTKRLDLCPRAARGWALFVRAPAEGSRQQMATAQELRRGAGGAREGRFGAVRGGATGQNI